MKTLNKYQHVTYFEDGGKMYVVVKAYGKNREWWHYEVWEAEGYRYAVCHSLDEFMNTINNYLT